MNYDEVDGGVDILGKPSDCPLVEVIPKVDYEARLKADMVDMLDELKKEIDMMSDTVIKHRTVTITSWKGMQKRISDLVQSKIDQLKGE